MKHGEFENIDLKPDQLERLNDRYGPELVATKIEELSTYLEGYKAAQKRYRSHYAVLLNWCRREVSTRHSNCTRVGHPTPVCRQDGCRF